MLIGQEEADGEDENQKGKKKNLSLFRERIWCKEKKHKFDFSLKGLFIWVHKKNVRKIVTKVLFEGRRKQKKSLGKFVSVPEEKNKKQNL